MKYLGIDYGTKRTGLATSDESGTVAFPNSIIETTNKLPQVIAEFIADHAIDEVVIGHSLDQRGQENDLMEDIRDFMAQLSIVAPIPIHLENEVFTSAEARRRPGFDGFEHRRQADQRRRAPVDTAAVDDRAAALILQRYLDKQAN